MSTLFISDLHLDASRPAATQAFHEFLKRRAARADALYILGDLFEAWIGDDDDDPLAGEIMDALAKLTSGGVPAWFAHGNRDFLVGDEFSGRTGVTLLPETSVVSLGEENVLLMHGDSLCTDDHDYQEFRAMVRDPDWQAQFLALPLAARRALAAQARDASRISTGGKPMEIMDVNAAAVAEAMRASGVRHAPSPRARIRTGRRVRHANRSGRLVRARLGAGTRRERVSAGGVRPLAGVRGRDALAPRGV